MGKKLNKLLTKLSMQSALILFETVVHATDAVRPSKKKHVSRPDFYIKESGQAAFFVIYYFLLHAVF